MAAEPKPSDRASANNVVLFSGRPTANNAPETSTASVASADAIAKPNRMSYILFADSGPDSGRDATLPDELMAEPTREEIDAKIAASEARNDTKFARIDGKMDLVLAKIEGYSGLVNTRFDASDKQTAMMREDIRGVKEDTRAARQNVWTVAGIVIATILAVVAIGVAVVAIMPPIYDAGTKLRDTVREEVKTQTDKPKAEPQPPAPPPDPPKTEPTK